jgi:hypothetical protein
MRCVNNLKVEINEIMNYIYNSFIFNILKIFLYIMQLHCLVVKTVAKQQRHIC